MISETLLRQMLPRCTKPGLWAAALAPAMQKYDVTSPARIASFLAQTGHESSQFNRTIESLVYTAAGRLMKVWPKRFPTEASAMPYVNKDQALGNFVYANRLGNGDAATGDGYRYRGRGLIQTTGRSNYRETGKALGLDLEDDPDLLLQPAHAAMGAAYFWSSRGLNALADDQTSDDDLEDFREITRRVNGGFVGVQERLALLNSIQPLLA